MTFSLPIQARRFGNGRSHHEGLRWPNGAGLAVSFVLNIEEGAELLLSAGDERNESVHEVRNEIKGVPDFCMETHFEYGARAGYRRVVVVLPYAFDTNDMRFFDQPAFVRGADFAAYVGDAVDQLLKESERAPRMLTIGLHTRIIGRPARIGGLDAVLAQLREQGDSVWIARREDIARHWLALSF